MADSASDEWRKQSQRGIRRFGHSSQYDTPMPLGDDGHDVAGLLARLSAARSVTPEKAKGPSAPTESPS